MNQGMETFEARLASFDTVLNPGKRRGSGTKPPKPISWPHSSPSPAELAHAGFYYEPHETNPDNARCFLCQSALDGWEEEDNPITEHLTLAQNCGWAIMMDIQRRTSNPAEIEDPTSERIVQARAATFGFSWPHDGKRGWVCQSEKMVAGGWYFCANEESNDLASCAYCKLSLDGWEPKDDPYEEHYRRSSDCSFFVFAQNQGKKPKSNRGRKPRSSKASRASSRSVSVEPADDYGYQTDQSMMSDASTKPKTAKRSTKSRPKASRSRKPDVEDTDDQMDAEESPEPKPKRGTRGKKRPSDQVEQGGYDGSVSPAPAPKKRATKTRGSAMRQASVDIDDSASVMTQDQDDVTSYDEEPKKGRRTTKKSSSTRGRKASDASSTATTKAPSKSRIPDDAELDAKLEADLARDAEYSEDEVVPEEPREKATKSTSKKASKSSKKSKPEPEPPVEHDEVPEDEEEEAPEDDEVEPVETKSRSQTKPSKSASKQKVNSSKSKEREQKSRASPEEEDTRPSKSKRYEPEDLSDADSIEEVKPKKSKKAPSDKTKKSTKESSKQPMAKPKPKEEIIDVEDSEEDEEPAEAEVDMPEQEEEMPEAPPEEEEEDQGQDQYQEEEDEEVDQGEQEEEEEKEEEEEEEKVESRPSRHQSSNHPHKTTERYSDVPHEQQFARSLTGSQGSGSRNERGNSRGAVSPIPSGLKSTPSLSPQSSDAENQPPSAKPSASRDHAPSPSKQASARPPPANNTPSPSKQRSNAGGVESSQTWTPIDIEAILSALDLDNENPGKPTGELTALEKKMTVEEWIQWQAKNGEERLKQECERLVGHFEKEGGRAMRVLESIECID